MQRAVELGDVARATCGGDPWVGSVVVADGVVVGEGAHGEFGGPHAEVLALEQAGGRSRGATVYVTLEPCNHHGRTPPCTDALIESGVARVVVGTEDPDPRVAGSGIARLRSQGIEVDVGVGRARVADSLGPYLHHRATGRSWCLAKAATSLDGRTAAVDGSSRWITGAGARADAHRLRGLSQAVVVGAGTALADQPSLTVRDVDREPAFPPLRVVADASGRVPAEGPLFDVELAPTLVVTTIEAPAESIAAWKAAGAQVEVVSAAPEMGVDLGELLMLLGRRNVVQTMVEGGATLLGSLAREDRIDELVLYLGGVLLGDEGRPVLGGLEVSGIADAPRWSILDATMLDGDVRLRCRPANREQVG